MSRGHTKRKINQQLQLYQNVGKESKKEGKKE